MTALLTAAGIVFALACFGWCILCITAGRDNQSQRKGTVTMPPDPPKPPTPPQEPPPVPEPPKPNEEL
jgi:hypothetical protein